MPLSDAQVGIAPSTNTLSDADVGLGLSDSDVGLAPSSVLSKVGTSPSAQVQSEDMQARFGTLKAGQPLSIFQKLRDALSPIMGPTIRTQSVLGAGGEPQGLGDVGLLPAAFNPHPEVPWALPTVGQQQGTVPQVAGAGYNLLANFINSVTTSPGGLMTGGIGGGIQRIAGEALPEVTQLANALQKAGLKLFAGTTVAGIPEEVSQARQTFARPDSTLQEKISAVGAPASSALLAGLLAHGAVKPYGPAEQLADLINESPLQGQPRGTEPQTKENVSPPSAARFTAPQQGPATDLNAKPVQPIPPKLPAGYKESEQPYRGGFVLTGPYVMQSGDVGSGVKGDQLYNRLKNLSTTGKLSPAEFDVYDKAGLKQAVDSGLSGEGLAKWMQENGPRVEVRKFGDNVGDYKTQTANTLQHEFETRFGSRYRIVNQYGAVDEGGQVIPAEQVTNPQARDLLLRYRNAYAEGNLVSGGNEPNWQSIAPKSERDMPGYVEIAVTKPLKTPVGSDTSIENFRERSGEQFPSQHSFPPNTLGFARGYMETLPNGKKVFHVIEVQSDWAQRVRDARAGAQEAANINQVDPDVIRERRGYPHNTPNDPLLRDYERLVLKAVIDHAKAAGADEVAVSDAETAMMTEGHDKQGNIVGYFLTREQAEQAAKEVKGGATIEQHRQGRPELWVVKANQLAQEPGMRLHYDTTLPRTLGELTGSEGRKVSFGEHKMSMIDQGGQTPWIPDSEPLEVRRRKDLIFRNPDGTPKTDVSATSFSLDKVKSREAFSLFDKDKPPKNVQAAPPGGDAARLQQLKSKTTLTSEEQTERDSLQAKSDSVRQQMQDEFQRLKGGEPNAKETKEKEKGDGLLGDKGGEVQPAPPATAKAGELRVEPGMSAADVLGQITKQHGDAENALAQHLLENFRPALMTAGVERGAHPTTESAAYDPNTHTISLDMAKDSRHVSNAIHESAHAATYWAFDNPRTAGQRAAKAEINRLWQAARKALPLEVNKFLEDVYSKQFKARQAGEPAALNQAAGQYPHWHNVLYSLTSPTEFIAQAYSDPTFREFLGGIEDKGSTVMDRLWNSFKKILGIKPGSVAESAFDAFEKLGDRESTAEAGQTRDVEPAPPIVKRAMDALEKTRDDFKGWLGGFPIRHDTIPRMMDEAANKANVAAKQTANDIRDRLKTAVGANGEKEDVALSMVIESKGDPVALSKMLQQESDPRVKASIQFAQNNYAKLKPVADYYEKVNRYEVNAENAVGIPTEFREGYVPHVTDMKDVNSVLFDRSSAGTGSGAFTKERVFNTLTEGRAAGTKYASLKASDLLEHRMRVGQNRVNTAKMVDTLKQLQDPTTGLPVIKDMLVKRKKGGEGTLETSAPAGYKPLYLGNHVVAVSKPYWGLLNTLTASSAFDDSLAGRFVMQAASTAKHTSLLFDLYHPIRLFFYSAPFRTSGENPLGALQSSKQGLFVLDYNKETLQRMAARGEIPQAMLPDLIRKKDSMAVALRTGFNIGRINDALYTEFLRKIPGIGTYNKWLFDKFQRGVMMEAYDTELQRVMKQDPSLSKDAAGRKVSDDLNKRFGNLMNQSWIKSKTGTDLLRMLFLAPQWNEGLLRSELGAGGQAVKIVADLALKRQFMAGGLVRSAGMLLAAQFIANQLLNMYTRGHPTWDNKDKYSGAKISAWVPDEIGKGPGYWINPLSLTAEISKSIIDRAQKDKSVVGAVDDVIKNKLSSLGRIANVLATREDWRGNHLKDWDVIKEAFKEGAPLPIQVPAIARAVQGKEQYPGEAQKSIMAGLGVKTDLATPSPEERLQAAADKMFPGRKVEQLSLGERKRLQASLPKPTEPDDRAKEAGAVKGIEQEFERKRDVRAGLSKPAQAFLEAHKLDIPAAEPELGQKVKMTESEAGKFQAALIREYEKAITSVEDDAYFNSLNQNQQQRVLNVRLEAAKNRARRSVRQ